MWCAAEAKLTTYLALADQPGRKTAAVVCLYLFGRMADRFGSRFVFVLLLLVPRLSRRHGGRVRISARQFIGSILALRFLLFRSRTP